MELTNDDVTLDPVIMDLRHADPAVRAQAAIILGLSGNPIVVEYLMSTLAFDQDLHVKRSAAIGLGNLGHPSGVQPLLLAVQAADAELRSFAAESLAKIRVPEVVEILMLALQGGVNMQLGAMEALSLIGDPRALPALEAMVPGGDARVATMRQSTMAILGAAAGEAHQALLTELQDPDPLLRCRAVEGLARRGLAEFAHLVGALEDGDAHVRARAATALGTLGDRAAVEALSVTLLDGDSLVRSAAAEALSRLGDTSCLPALQHAIDLLGDDSSRREMLELLGKLTQEALG